MQSKEEALVETFEEFIQNKDTESLALHIPKLLKAYLKNAKRTNRILQQTDAQQFNVLKLQESLEETNQKVNMLLNNANQGFLYFDNNMLIGQEISKEVTSIFQKDIVGNNITQLLYADDNSAQEFLQTTLQGILKDNEMRQEILISLLETNFIIHNKNIKIEYKILNKHTFMMILTDITANIKLDKKIKDERQTLKMIVEVETSTEQFLELLDEYKKFINDIQEYKALENLVQLRMQIHTFKGLFAQKEILNIVEKLHHFETLIDISIKNDKLDSEINNMTTQIMYSWIETDINTIENILGYDFFEKSNYIEIDKYRLESLYEQSNVASKDELRESILELQNYNIMIYFKPYIKLVEQLSVKLEKPMKPLIINSNEIYIDNKFKLFFNALVHIFRNSVDHGIESMEERSETNKDEEGAIICNITKDTDNLTIEIGDDGKGIDLDIIKNLAITKGIYTQEEINKLANEDILKIIFQDSFTTNEDITDISGRGVGLASVLYELNQLDGNLNIENEKNKGIKFIFQIPLKETMSPSSLVLDKLAHRTIRYFEQDLKLNINKDFKISTVDEIKHDDITTLIALTDDINGTIAMSVSSDLAYKIAKSFIFGTMEKDELEELKYESIAETLNITLGNILHELSDIEKGTTVGMTIPTQMPANTLVSKQEYNSILLCELKLEDEIIILSYFI